MLLRLVFVFCLAMAFNAPAWAEATPSQDAKIDPMVELNKLSEGDILTIEYCLAALYYYPNELTGKPSEKLVEAIINYQKDYLGHSVTGYISSRDLLRLLTDSAGMSLGNILQPADLKKKVVLLKSGSIAEAMGLWANSAERFGNPTQRYSHIVCFKKEGNCIDNQIYASSYYDSGWSTYITSLGVYKIEKFDDEELIASFQESYDKFDDNPLMKDRNLCTLRKIFINFSAQEAKLEIRKNDERSDPRCPKKNIANTYYLVDADQSPKLHRYTAMQNALERSDNRDEKQKDQLLKMLASIQARIRTEILLQK